MLFVVRLFFALLDFEALRDLLDFFDAELFFRLEDSLEEDFLPAPRSAEMAAVLKHTSAANGRASLIKRTTKEESGARRNVVGF